MTLGKTAAGLLLAEQAQWEAKQETPLIAVNGLNNLVKNQYFKPDPFFDWEPSELDIF